jgi:ribosomal protein L24
MKEVSTKLKTKLKVGDKVQVIAGKYSGGKRKLKKGEKRAKTKPLIDYILKINFQKQLVYLKKKDESKETIVPIHISNVAY